MPVSERQMERPAVRALRLVGGFVLFQAAWFACVIGAARGESALGVAAVVAVLAVLLALSSDRGAELRLIAIALALGLVWDTLLARTGIVDYASPVPQSGWAPAWILALWALFAPMLRESMRWLHGRPLVGALFGGVGGALSYAAAERLGACRFPDPALALTVLGAGWAVIIPLLLAAAQRLDRSTSPRPVVATSIGARA